MSDAEGTDTQSATQTVDTPTLSDVPKPPSLTNAAQFNPAGEEDASYCGCFNLDSDPQYVTTASDCRVLLPDGIVRNKCLDARVAGQAMVAGAADVADEKTCFAACTGRDVSYTHTDGPRAAELWDCQSCIESGQTFQWETVVQGSDDMCANIPVSDCGQGMPIPPETCTEDSDCDSGKCTSLHSNNGKDGKVCQPTGENTSTGSGNNCKLVDGKCVGALRPTSYTQNTCQVGVQTGQEAKSVALVGSDGNAAGAQCTSCMDPACQSNNPPPPTPVTPVDTCADVNSGEAGLGCKYGEGCFPSL